MTSCALALAVVVMCTASMSGCRTRHAGDASAVDTDAQAATAPKRASTAPKLGPIWQEIPGAAFKFELVPVPGDEAQGIVPFWMSRYELTWEAFDAFVYPREGTADAVVPGAGAGADAVTRPSKPYLPPDRGFGHEGFAAITMSHKNAEAFCAWLSAVSGRTFRLATEAEWEHACKAGGTDLPVNDAAALNAVAWYRETSGGVPHAVGSKQPNAWGLHDMHGNVAEWVNGRDGKPVVKGGSYRSGAEALLASARELETRAWNATDPQIPKSQWWLADAPFVGFRVVCEVEGIGDGRKP